jgi:hypothetical protein
MKPSVLLRGLKTLATPKGMRIFLKHHSAKAKARRFIFLLPTPGAIEAKLRSETPFPSKAQKRNVLRKKYIGKSLEFEITKENDTRYVKFIALNVLIPIAEKNHELDAYQEFYKKCGNVQKTSDLTFVKSPKEGYPGTMEDPLTRILNSFKSSPSIKKIVSLQEKSSQHVRHSQSFQERSVGIVIHPSDTDKQFLQNLKQLEELIPPLKEKLESIRPRSQASLPPEYSTTPRGSCPPSVRSVASDRSSPHTR